MVINRLNLYFFFTATKIGAEDESVKRRCETEKNM